jgi:hypothetical protein
LREAHIDKEQFTVTLPAKHLGHWDLALRKHLAYSTHGVEFVESKFIWSTDLHCHVEILEV